MWETVTRAWQIGIRLGILLAVLSVALTLPFLHPGLRQSMGGEVLSTVSVALTLGLLYYAGFETVRHEERPSLGALAGAVVGGVRGLLSSVPNYYIWQATVANGRSESPLVMVLSIIVAVVVWTLIGLVVGFLGGSAARPGRQVKGRRRGEGRGD